MTKVALLYYGMGNLHSAGKALTAVGADVSITRDPAVIAAADKIVFPGVGAMRDCMAEMQAAGIADAVKTAVFNKPVMAICVGMQALFQQSEENSTQISSPDNQVENGPNGPPLDNDIPIDDYLPVLAITASAIMVYHYKIKNHKMVK